MQLCTDITTVDGLMLWTLYYKFRFLGGRMEKGGEKKKYRT